MNTGDEEPQNLSSDPSEWPDSFVEAIRAHHANHSLRLWAAEELSRRVAIRNLSPADAQAALDAKEAGR